MAIPKPMEHKKIQRKPSDFKHGRAYDRPKVKSAFFDSDYVESLSRMEKVFGKVSGTMRSQLTGRSEEKKQMSIKAQQEAARLTKEKLIEQYQPKTEELVKMKAGIINICKVFMNNAITTEERTVGGKKVKVQVLNADISDVKTVYNMIKIELGEPTNISTFDPESGGLGHMTVSFGDGVGKSQFIKTDK